MSYDYLFKILVIGDSTVGKSTLIKRFADDVFEEKANSTFGIDFKVTKLTIDKKVCRLQLWDTAGQERYRSITHSIFRGVDAVLLCYDITNRTSFNNIDRWYDSVKQYCIKDVKVLLIGTKSDLKERREVPQVDGEGLAEYYGLDFMEISSRHLGREDLRKVLFMGICSSLIYGSSVPPKQDKDTVDIQQIFSPTDQNNNSYRNCCVLM